MKKTMYLTLKIFKPENNIAYNEEKRSEIPGFEIKHDNSVILSK